jgi:hypothetical protein
MTIFRTRLAVTVTLAVLLATGLSACSSKKGPSGGNATDTSSDNAKAAAPAGQTTTGTPTGQAGAASTTPAKAPSEASGRKDAAATSSGSSPQGHQADLETLREALVASDRETYGQQFQASQEQQVVVGSVFDYMASCRQLRACAVKAYGQLGWERIYARCGGQLEMPDYAQAKITTNSESEANMTVPGSEMFPRRLTRQDGRWVIDASAFVPCGGDVARAKALIDAADSAVTQAIWRIERGELTAEQAEEWLATELSKALDGKGW